MSKRMFSTSGMLFLGICCFLISGSVGQAQDLFDIPIRINMGGAETVDSHGRTWLGDPGVNTDVLGIRPEDVGGGNAAANWSLGAMVPASFTDLGYDPDHPGDRAIFNTIRWDNGADALNFDLQIPVPNGTYTVNLFFNEACCANRHFKIVIQGTVVEEDQFSTEFGVLIKKSYEAIVEDNVLSISLPPCPDCPGVGDLNAILDALEVLGGDECDHLGSNFSATFNPESVTSDLSWSAVAGATGYNVLRNGANISGTLASDATSYTDNSPEAGAGGVAVYILEALDGENILSSCASSITPTACSGNLTCNSTGPNEVSLTWTPSSGKGITGYEIHRDGELIDTVGAEVTEYTDSPGKRITNYSVTPLSDPAGACPVMTCRACIESFEFDLPLRLNLGGPDVEDSRGRIWTGDNSVPSDDLCIRPNDLGGTNTIPNWCPPKAGGLERVGFNSGHPGDVALLTTIRWDVGADAEDYRLELPIPNGDNYSVSLFFHECCCPGRHFKIEIEGEIIEEDVHAELYDADPFVAGTTGRFTFDGIAVTDGALSIGILPCADCDATPHALDTNGILSAVEVLEDLCTDPTFGQCVTDFDVNVDENGQVNGSWVLPICRSLEGFDVLKDGELLTSLAGDATSFQDTMDSRLATYTLVSKVGEEEEGCPDQSKSLIREGIPFEVPLRINMGGRSLTDSLGREWIGDGPGPGDPLSIRPDDAGGTNTLVNWCAAASQLMPQSLQSYGLDPFNPDDVEIFNTIRWDLGGDGIDYRLNIPLPDGDYLVNLYFTECCCPQRNFRVEIGGEIVEETVNTFSYSASGATGVTGRLSYDFVLVQGGVLDLALLPCAECPAGADPNPIVDAIEILPAGSTNPVCARDFTCTVDGDGVVTGQWTAGADSGVESYEVFRNGEFLLSVPAGEAMFTDTPDCSRAVVYEVKPNTVVGTPLCPELTLQCVLPQLDCPFASPVRLNMGGPTARDSQGQLWLGDPGAGVDTWDIRPVDNGGTNVIADFVGGNTKPESYAALGFDANFLADRVIFNSIRWDPGADDDAYILEIPVNPGEYAINLYFNEGCCPNRHMTIDVQGQTVAEDISGWDFDPAADILAVPPVAAAPGHLGQLAIEGVDAPEGLITISLVPCVDCFEPIAANIDLNTILNAVEIIGTSPPGPLFKRGDVNGDGMVDVSDPVSNLQYQFLGTFTPGCLDAADFDDNGKVEITDPVSSLSHQFLGNPPPPEPGKDVCGLDPTEDDVSCDESHTCDT